MINIPNIIYYTSLIFMALIISCDGSNQTDQEASQTKNQTERPNILWLVTEDMSPYIPAFGDSTIQTPNLSRLAEEGIRYTNLFSPSGVCAPSRAAIASGLYPTSFGANHMRTHSHRDITGLPYYEAVPPAEAEMMSQILRRNGYYCTNNLKQDYQFKPPVTAWDESSPYAHWRNRQQGQPFFSIFNFTVTHESGLFEPYGFRKMENRHYFSGDTTYEVSGFGERMSEEETAVHIPKDLDFNIPPYLPNTPVVKRDMWKMYNNIAEMDRQLGAILEQLESDGMLENTIIFFYADHGGPLPRQKRLIYDSGLESPMIIRFPGRSGVVGGQVNDELVSFIDFAPTILSLAGIEPPDYLHGRAFLGEYEAQKKRNYIHAAADRLDEFTDAIRAVRDKRFKYIRNYRPEQGYYLPVAYREQIPTMKELLRLRDEGKLNEAQSQWFRKNKPAEELFDTQNDPHELKNLANDPEYQDKLKELSAEMDRWLTSIGDKPNMPEKQLVLELWDGASKQPATSRPEVQMTDGRVTITCPTEGAAIGYKLFGEDKETDAWSIYQEPFQLPEQVDSITVNAHRIGFVPIQITVFPTELE
ncbi:MAG: sulfatase family protein [Candidatus Cyclobacteriaceae bacterium M3_2C_046]